MTRKLIDILLIAMIAIGGFRAWQSGRQRSRLSQWHNRLVRKAGEPLPIDLGKIATRAIDSGEPLYFAWRVGVPFNHKYVLSKNNGVQTTSWAGSPREFITRARIRETDEGRLRVYTKFANSSSMTDLGDERLAAFLRGRWDRVRVEQVGLREPAVVDPDQPVVLLKLSLPDDLAAEAHQKLSDEDQELVPVLFEWRLSSPNSPK